MTIEQANEYFSSLPEGFAPAEELRAALTADVQKVQFVGVSGTAGKTAAAGLLFLKHLSQKELLILLWFVLLMFLVLLHY